MSKRFILAFIALFCAVLPISSMGKAEPSNVRPAESVDQRDYRDHLLDVAAAL
jgi:hypothetical protein